MPIAILQHHRISRLPLLLGHRGASAVPFPCVWPPMASRLPSIIRVIPPRLRRSSQPSMPQVVKLLPCRQMCPRRKTWSGFLLRRLMPMEPSAPSYTARASRSEEHTSELQSLMRISYAVFCLKKKKNHDTTHITPETVPQT